MSNISFIVNHKGAPHTLTVTTDSPASDVFARLHELTDVQPELQKLLVKGKSLTLSNVGEKAVGELGIPQGAKVMLVGSTQADLGGMQKKEEEDQRRARIMRERAAKGPTKLRSTGSSSSSSPSLTYRFHKTEPLAHLPNPAAASALLNRLSADPAVSHLLETHQFSIGLLTELAPHEHPNLLGLNENRGEVIRLRLRTDRYDGFRNYPDVRRVLVHELTHCVFGPHDDDFKNLNSQMNKEIAAYELSVRSGTHSLRAGEVYEPTGPSITETESHQHILGGRMSPSVAGDSAEERRRRLLNAAVARAKREEEELEAQCGSAP